MSLDSHRVVYPAAGLASRLGGVPKFLLPNASSESILASHTGSCELPPNQKIVVTRPTLVDFVAEHLGGAARVVGLPSISGSQSVLFGARQDSAVSSVSIALPDTIVSPAIDHIGLYSALGECDIAIAAFPTRGDQQGKLGGLVMRNRAVQRIVDKDASKPTQLHWGAVAMHSAVLWEFAKNEDQNIGIAVNRALASGLTVHVAQVGTSYFDVGTLSEYVTALTLVQ